MKKSKLLKALIKLFSLQNFTIPSLRMFFHNEAALKKLKKTVYKRDLGFLNSTAQKDFLNYITSRNMRKTILPSNVKNVLTQPEMNVVNLKQILHVILHKLRKSKQLLYMTPSMGTQKWALHGHSMPSMGTKNAQLKCLISNESQGAEAAANAEEPEHWGGEESFKLIKFIKNFDEALNANASVLIFFYAYWCRHCLRFKHIYGKTALMAKQANVDMIFGAFDVTTNPDMADVMGVVGIPTVKYYKNGKFIAVYKGKRTSEDLLEFVKNPPPAIEQRQPDI